MEEAGIVIAKQIEIEQNKIFSKKENQSNSVKSRSFVPFSNQSVHPYFSVLFHKGTFF